MPEPFLQSLTTEDRDRLFRIGRRRRYAAGEEIIARDQADRDVYVMLKGRAQVTIFSAEGKAVAYREVEEGDMFGELSAIDGGLRSASAIARGEAELVRVEPAEFLRMLDASPAFSRAVMIHLCAIVRRTTERILEFSTLLVRQRLGRELLRLARPTGDDEAAEIRPAPTHFDLAARISTHREAVSREMSRLAKRELIQRRRGALHIPSLPRLAAEQED